MAARLFPFLDWRKGYNSAYFKTDLTAGLTVALVLIPQSMAYAQLAGLPPYIGLYAAFLPPLAAALFGSSRQLATGPVAVVSLMTAASLEPLATAGSQAFIGYTLILALLIGLFQMSLGLLRLGALVSFISHPVVNGFSNAAALIIASSQLSKLLGVQVEKAEYHLQTLARVVSAAVHYLHWPSLILGILALGLMIGLKRFYPRSPYVLVAVVVTTLLSWSLGLEAQTKAPLGAIASKELAGSIQEFNRALTDLEHLTGERSRYTDQARLAEKSLGPNSPEVVRLSSLAAIAGHRMDEARALIGFARTDIRRILLTRVPGTEDRYHEQGREPRGTEGDGRTWRVMVGEQRLDPQNLTLIGGGEVVGQVPAGLPSFSVPSIDPDQALELLPYAVIISLLGFMEAISVAKAMASRTGQRIDPDQELVGQGLANIIGSFFQSFPVAGSFSRSAVNLQAGARTGISSLVTFGTVWLVLLFFTPLLYHLPKSVLAAVIMVAVAGLINISGFVHAWRAQKYDGIISVLTFMTTLVAAPHLDIGLGLGVFFSLAIFLYKSMRPKVVDLAPAEDGTFHDAAHFGLDRCRHLAIIRFEGQLFFANAGLLEDKIRSHRLAMPELRQVIIAAEDITELDASGEEALSHVIDRLRRAQIGISFAGLHWRVREVLERTRLLPKIGPENIYPDLWTALRRVYPKAHRETDAKKDCPLYEAFRKSGGRLSPAGSDRAGGNPDKR